jgi:NMD protein affecting ribosome stability and mRNA decay
VNNCVICGESTPSIYDPVCRGCMESGMSMDEIERAINAATYRCSACGGPAEQAGYCRKCEDRFATDPEAAAEWESMEAQFREEAAAVRASRGW